MQRCNGATYICYAISPSEQAAKIIIVNGGSRQVLAHFSKGEVMKILELLRPGMLAQVSAIELGPDTPPGVFVSLESPITRYLVFTHRGRHERLHLAVQLEASHTRPAFSYITLSKPTALYGLHCAAPYVQFDGRGETRVYTDRCGWLRVRGHAVTIGCTSPDGLARSFRIPEFEPHARQWTSRNHPWGGDFESYSIGVWVMNKLVPLYQSSRILPFRERYDAELRPAYPSAEQGNGLKLAWPSNNLLQ